MTPATPMNPNPEPHPSRDAALDLGAHAASRLIQAAATIGQTIIDLDNDPTLEEATVSRGCYYRTASLTPDGQSDSRTDRADIVVARWPRPDGHLSWMTRAPQTLRAVRRILTPSGLLAVVLEPTPIEQFTITWTGVLLSATASAGLTVLQDVICLHDRLATAGLPDAAGRRSTERHRVILIVRAATGRHGNDDAAAGGTATTHAVRVHKSQGWTIEQVRDLGMTTDLETAAEILGIGRTLAYDLIKNDQFPVRLLRLGRRVLIPVPELLQFLTRDPQAGS